MKKRYIYINNSLAYDYDSYYHDGYQTKRLKTAEKKRNFNKSKDTRGFSLSLVLFFVVILLGCMSILINICIINKKSHELIVLQNELKLLKSDNTALEDELSRRFDLGYIEKIAREKLGMHEPFDWQKVIIKKPQVNCLQKYNN